jgi:hypothetical protein
MIRDNTTILRYKGGSGGEAFYRWLDACAAGIGIDPVPAGEGIRNAGPIGGLLQSEWTGDAARHAGLPNTRWEELEPWQVRSVIEGELKPVPGRKQVLMHGHYVMHGRILRGAFPEAFIIDLMPRREDVWLCHAMQMAKEMARRLTVAPPWVLDLPGSDAITSCLESNGWFPAFWVRMVSDGVDVRDIAHMFRHISNDGKNLQEGGVWLDGGNAVIDAGSWLLGNGTDHLAVLGHLGLETSEDREGWVLDWKRHNAHLLDGFGSRIGASDPGMRVESAVGPLLEDLNRLVLR